MELRNSWKIRSFVQDLMFAGLGNMRVPGECRNRLAVRRLSLGAVSEW